MEGLADFAALNFFAASTAEFLFCETCISLNMSVISNYVSLCVVSVPERQENGMFKMQKETILPSLPVSPSVSSGALPF